jgi:hypothetical protein
MPPHYVLSENFLNRARQLFQGRPIPFVLKAARESHQEPGHCPNDVINLTVFQMPVIPLILNTRVCPQIFAMLSMFWCARRAAVGTFSMQRYRRRI